jgi:hypothetical protein
MARSIALAADPGLAAALAREAEEVTTQAMAARGAWEVVAG